MANGQSADIGHVLILKNCVACHGESVEGVMSIACHLAAIQR